MTYPATLIAFAFVEKGISEEKYVTQMKLQKMVYFAHGYYLSKYNDPLIKETFEAWQFGPVVSKIYNDYKFYGSSPITDTELLNWVKSATDHDLKSLDSYAKDAIDYTWEALKDVTASKLSNWTHKNGSPWNTYYKAGSKDIPIPNEDIKLYFQNFLSHQ